MSDMDNVIDLDIDESNELMFKIDIEGDVSSPSPVKVRLVCEMDDMAYMFHGHPTEDDGIVSFVIPRMSDRVKPGSMCESRVEVMVENRYFAPVQFGINFKKTMTVVAEAVSLPKQRVKPSGIQVTAAPVVANKKPLVEKKVEPQRRPAVIEKPRPGSLAARYNRKKRDK